MPAPDVSLVSHVSDTARWVAVYRAMESERPDALFHDPWARKLAGPEGEAILRSIPNGVATAWPMIVRTHVMDELILHALGGNGGGIDTVLNLASGLDARPYRLPLPPSLRWIEVDLPDVLTYKQGILPGERVGCTLEYAPTDLTDDGARRKLFQQVGASTTRTLVITEGLLVYLQREQVAGLAADLAAQPSFRSWLIDLASPDLLKRLNKTLGKSLQKAPLIFGPAEGTQFFESYGWQEAEFRSMFEESLRLKRTMRFAQFFKFLGRFYPKKMQARFRRMSGIVMLKRK
jgi:methyltransferase (TIGR00027 family)